MFEMIDEAIHDWAKSHGLSWSMTYRDEEVRSIEVFLAHGRTAQIWLEHAEGTVWKVRAWDRKHRNFSSTAEKPQLWQALSEALTIVRSWASA